MTHHPNSATTTVDNVWVPDGGIFIRCARMNMDSGSLISLTNNGYLGGDTFQVFAPLNGCGPGGSIYKTSATVQAGAGYGGRGGKAQSSTTNYVGLPYGSKEEPAEPGSGGAATIWSDQDHPGGIGGGYVRIDAYEMLTINGTINANGQSILASKYGGPGSGGGIMIRTQTIEGSGILTAEGGQGGHSGNSGGAGGGRIAIRCQFNHFSGTCSVGGGTGYENGEPGTIYWRIQGPGSVFTLF